ncbi:nuclear transport factor 2 family protein [Streptomyces asiaticus]
MNNKEHVLQAAAELFGKQDPSAVDRWISPEYIQHSSLAADGPEALRTLISSLPDDFRYEGARVIVDGDLVALHGTYHGFGPQSLVAFDLFRVDADGKLAEHWDALIPLVTDTASGRSQTDGPAEPSDLDKTEPNRAFVLDFAETVLKSGDYSMLTDYISNESYHEHNPEVANSLDGFAAAVAKWAEPGKNLVYRTIHRAVAEGDFVLLQSEGDFVLQQSEADFKASVAYWDLFRVTDGKIVEHWDVIAPAPAELPHTNGLF